MNFWAQLASGVALGSHGNSAGRLDSALPARAWAALAYLSRSMPFSGVSTLLKKRSPITSSAGSALVGTGSSMPSRSRTVFRYWTAVRRRSGATPALVPTGAGLTMGSGFTGIPVSGSMGGSLSPGFRFGSTVPWQAAASSPARANPVTRREISAMGGAPRLPVIAPSEAFLCPDDAGNVCRRKNSIRINTNDLIDGLPPIPGHEAPSDARPGQGRDLPPKAAQGPERLGRGGPLRT